MEALKDSEFGPSCLLYKNLDYPIVYSRGQCANNCFSYALNNIASGKSAYYSYNNYDWFYYGTVSSGIPLNFDNTTYQGRNNYEGAITPVSSKFWRFVLLNSDRVIVLNDILVFYQSTRIPINKILLPDLTPGYGTSYISSDGSNIPTFYILKDSFSLGTWDEFSIFGSKNPTVSISNNTYMHILGRTGDINLSTYVFEGTNNFEFNIHYKIPYATTVNIPDDSSCKFEFYNNVSRKVFYLVWATTSAVANSSCNSSAHTFKIFFEDTQIYSNNSLGCYFNTAQINKICLRKAGNWISLYLGEHIYITTFTYTGSDIITSFYFRVSSQITSIDIYRLDFIYKVLLSKNSWVSIELKDNTPLDKLQLIATGATLTLDTQTSTNNISYSSNNTIVLSKYDMFIRFVLDLVNRHSLSIVRNYGIGELFDISIHLDTIFSNTSGYISQAIFNSTYMDCRWLCIKIQCSDNIIKSIEKLGVYTDITKMYCLNGGYNNTWSSLPTNLTTYTPIINVALNSTVSGTTFYNDNIPEKVNDGMFTDYTTDACWAFEKGTNPKIYFEFGTEYNVGSFSIHPGYSPSIPKGFIKSYKFSLDNTPSGTSRTWSTICQVNDITTSSKITYNFNYRYARRALVEILDFDAVPVFLNDYNSFATNIYLGYIREIEIFSKEPLLYISSEDYPIVCMDLRDTFQVVDVKLYNSLVQGSNDLTNINNNYWDNNNEFICYSDSLVDIPHKAQFMRGQDYSIEYENTINTGDLKYSIKYLIDTSIFIAKGHHYLDWYAYYATNVESVSIDLEGSVTITLYAANYGSGWKKQTSEFFIDSEGYFNIYARQNVDAEASWGVKDILMYRLFGLTKWVAVVRDTATNYSYDFQEDKFGPDFLDKIEVYGGDKYVPTEYWWWWRSDLASLSNDSVYTKVGKRSLKINYPASSSMDFLRLIEADHFGQDYGWSLSDSLSFYLFIDNINNIDVTFGKITLGSINGTTSDFYYWWDISNLNLITGWNKIVLNFYDYSGVYPINTTGYYTYIESELNLQNNGRNITTFNIMYRGTGNPLTMFLDHIHIKRNTFETTVKYSKGLCLTYHDYLAVPLSNINLDKGSLEFWVRMGVDTLGRDSFGNIHSATLFTLSSNNNDMMSLRIKPGNWFEIFAGNIRKQSLFNIENLPAKAYVKRGSLIHIGIVWSNDGAGNPYGRTIQLFINGLATMVSTTQWQVSDTKLSFFKLGGGVTQTSQIFDTQSNFVFENIKIYNYCKESFSINTQNIDEEYLLTPEHFIELSKDGLSFVGVGSTELPFIYEQVPSKDSITLHVRTNKYGKFKSSASNAQVLINWLITV